VSLLFTFSLPGIVDGTCGLGVSSGILGGVDGVCGLGVSSGILGGADGVCGLGVSSGVLGGVDGVCGLGVSSGVLGGVDGVCGLHCELSVGVTGGSSASAGQPIKAKDIKLANKIMAKNMSFLFRFILPFSCTILEIAKITEWHEKQY
jgi:hypothetical protein